MAAEGATQVVDEQAVGDLEEPRGERATRVVAVPGPVDAQEELLIEVLRALGRAGAPHEEGVCPWLVASEELLEGLPVSVGVSRHEGLIRYVSPVRAR